MGGAGDFLAGLLGGLGETYGAAMLEKRRIDLTKKQLEQQNRQFEMQLAATKENTAAQMSLQERLATRGMDIDEKKMYYQGRMQLIMQQLDAAQRSGDIRLHAELQKDLMSTQWALGQIDAERSVERDVSRANQIGEGDIGRKARIIGMEEASRRRLMHTEAAIRDASTAKDLTLQGQIQRQGQLFNFLTTTLQHMVERGDIEEDRARELKDKILLIGTNAEASVPGSGTRVQAFAQTYLDDLSESLASGQMSSFHVDASRILDMDPKEAVAELMKSFKKPPRADSRPTGKTKPPPSTFDRAAADIEAKGVPRGIAADELARKGVYNITVDNKPVSTFPNYDYQDPALRALGPHFDKWASEHKDDLTDAFYRYRASVPSGTGDVSADFQDFKNWMLKAAMHFNDSKGAAWGNPVQRGINDARSLLGRSPDYGKSMFDNTVSDILEQLKTQGVPEAPRPPSPSSSRSGRIRKKVGR